MTPCRYFGKIVDVTYDLGMTDNNPTVGQLNTLTWIVDHWKRAT